MRFPIFKPKGRAREFSPLAMDIWQGCDHFCKYCFNNRPGRKFEELATPRPNVLKNLKAQLEKYGAPKEQVLLTFSGDPYCKAEEKTELTRSVLEVLCEHNVPVAILTKGGKRCLRDLDLFKKFNLIKVGATLVFSEEKDRKIWESGATPTQERIDVLRELHENGIQTWVSLEPVIDPLQTLELIDITSEFVDGYKISQLNYHPEVEPANWTSFVVLFVESLRKTEKPFYVKNDLAAFAPKDFFRPEERDANFMALKVN